MIDTTRLRCAVGWLGMLLPWMLLILSCAYGYGFPNSISQTYYFESCITPFMIVLGSAGLLLLSYKGYDKQDRIVCSLAGIFGIAVCIFPSSISTVWDVDGIVGTFQIAENISGRIHDISSVVFFALLAYNSLFLFTKSSGEMTENKKKRNVIFRICGIGMIASFLLIIPVYIFDIHGGAWFVEAIALIFFGISWLTKADCYPWLFADKK